MPSSGQFVKLFIFEKKAKNKKKLTDILFYLFFIRLLQMAASHHMQMSADVKVNAGMANMQMRQQQHMVQQQQQQQSMFYQNQTASATVQQPSGAQQQPQAQVVQQQQAQQQPGMENSYTYSASQTQTINFTQQHLRANTRMPASLSVQQQAAQQQQQAMQQQQAQQQQQVNCNTAPQNKPSNQRLS